MLIDLNTINELSYEKSAYESSVKSFKYSISWGSELYSIILGISFSLVFVVEIFFEVFNISISFFIKLIWFFK